VGPGSGSWTRRGDGRRVRHRASETRTPARRDTTGTARARREDRYRVSETRGPAPRDTTGTARAKREDRHSATRPALRERNARTGTARHGRRRAREMRGPVPRERDARTGTARSTAARPRATGLDVEDCRLPGSRDPLRPAVRPHGRSEPMRLHHAPGSCISRRRRHPWPTGTPTAPGQDALVDRAVNALDAAAQEARTKLAGRSLEASPLRNGTAPVPRSPHEARRPQPGSVTGRTARANLPRRQPLPYLERSPVEGSGCGG